MSVRLSFRFKGHDHRGIRAKLVGRYGRDAETAEPVKHLVRESDGHELDLIYFFETRRTSSDIVEAASKVLNEKPSISRQDIAASTRASGRVVKRTFSKVFSMKKFSL
jgi:hypothetical protein